MDDSGQPLKEEDPNDFPTDDQVREYTEACLNQYANNVPDGLSPRLAFDDPEAFMKHFLTSNPEVRAMKYLGAGRYEIDYS